MILQILLFPLPWLASAIALPPSTQSLAARGGAGNRVIEHSEGMDWYSYSLKDGGRGYSDENHYTCFYGDASKFPPISAWMNFEALWSLNQRDYMNVKPQDGPAVQAAIKHAVIYISQCARVDPRVILAVMMQESSADTCVTCTAEPGSSYRNCGLMQGPPGSITYDPSNIEGSITRMIQDGTQGTKGNGPRYHGLVQWINIYGNLYKALRAYNSGSVDESNLDNAFEATPSYVSDLANRLLGTMQSTSKEADIVHCVIGKRSDSSFRPTDPQMKSKTQQFSDPHGNWVPWILSSIKEDVESRTWATPQFAIAIGEFVNDTEVVGFFSEWPETLCEWKQTLIKLLTEEKRVERQTALLSERLAGMPVGLRTIKAHRYMSQRRQRIKSQYDAAEASQK
ncbi:hypothetical protein MMC13_004917 [Lambiella insularis]|nr:hypothetical protein [Lambiella insularis]